MEFFAAHVQAAAQQTLSSLADNWPYLLASVVLAAALRSAVDAAKAAAWLRKFRGTGVVVATGVAVATPFCSCGTTAVVLGMAASALPLAPIVAFMVASPLSSPEELVFSAGLFGWPFALAYFGASVALGLAGGGLAALLERRGLLADQLRVGPAGGEPSAPEAGSCGCAPDAGARPRLRVKLQAFARAGSAVALQLVPRFLAFAFLGYLLNSLVPASWLPALFGARRVHGVPLAATIGLPLYVSSESSLPLVRALADGGMSPGAVMAFLLAGSGTSVGAVSGALTIVRGRVVALVVAVLWAGAILAGWAFDLLVAFGLA